MSASKRNPQSANKPDPLQPSMVLLITLGSLVVHIDEMISPNGHPFDVEAVKSLLTNQELKDWLKQMDRLALLPKKR